MTNYALVNTMNQTEGSFGKIYSNLAREHEAQQKAALRAHEAKSANLYPPCRDEGAELDSKIVYADDHPGDADARRIADDAIDAWNSTHPINERVASRSDRFLRK